VLLHTAEDGKGLAPVGESLVVPVGAVETGREFVFDGRVGGRKFQGVVVLGDCRAYIVGFGVGTGEVEVSSGRCRRALELAWEKVFGVG
jgi:hypothetical protein